MFAEGPGLDLVDLGTFVSPVRFQEHLSATVTFLGHPAWAWEPSAFARGSHRGEHPAPVGFCSGMLGLSVPCSEMLSFSPVVQLHVLPSCN